jgi:2-C-methyl-D-erythritol 4-phosphate cytidylyltransferase
MLVRTLDRLAELSPSATIVALAQDDTEFERFVGDRGDCEGLRCGGATRAETVRNALAALAARCGRHDWIVVHDAARPCVPRDALARLVRELDDDAVGGLLAVPVADTLKRTDDGNRVLATEDRASLWQAQTPQMFRFGILEAAYALAGAHDSTDDARVVEALAATGACRMPRVVLGSPMNIKVTYAEDVRLATAILEAQGAT